MEVISFNNSRGLKLVGDLYTADSDSCVIMTHGFTGNRVSKGRSEPLAKSLVLSGINAFRFDFSGCGDSQDDTITLDKEIDDLRSAMSTMRSRGFKRIALYGHSLGSLICLKCGLDDVRSMVLSGAMTGSMKYDLGTIYSPQQVEEMNLRGYLIITDEGGRTRRIDRRIFQDFEQINQEELCRGVRRPVLIIHGNNRRDTEEKMLLERSRRAIPLLPPGSALEVIEGADHSLLTHFDRVIALATEWFKKFM